MPTPVPDCIARQTLFKAPRSRATIEGWAWQMKALAQHLAK